MVTFTLTTPMQASFSDARMVRSLRLTGFAFTSVPDLAPTGSGQMSIVLTEPDSGVQVPVSYKDASVLSFFSQPAPTPQPGNTVEDITAQLVFAKLMADGKLPPGTVATA